MLQSFVKTVTATSAKRIMLLPADPNRMSILLSPPAANRYSVLPDSPGGSDERGLLLNQYTSPLLLTREQYGDLIAHSWSVIAGPAPSSPSDPPTVVKVNALVTSDTK
jgi:hypothetical protein